MQMEFPGFPRSRGRSRTGKAVPVKDRVRVYRSRKAIEHAELEARYQHMEDATLARYIVHVDDPVIQRACWVELGRRMGWR